MFSKDPTELVRKDKMSNEEISRSIRLALAAELDAINFYLQQSSLIPDGAFKKVHEDIAKEEVTHFGEFMRLLYEYEPEDFGKIMEGWKEASGLLKGDENPGEIQGFIEKGDYMEKNKEEAVPNLLEHFEIFRLIDWQSHGVPLPEDEGKIVPLKRMTHQFSLRKGSPELYRKEAMRENLRIFLAQIGEELFLNNELSLLKRSEKMKSGDWSKGGEILGDIIEAKNKLVESGYTSKPLVLISSEVNRLLLRQSENSGQSEVELIREGVGNVHVSNYLRGNSIVVLRPESFWIFIGGKPEVKLISETADAEQYVAECKLAPLLYNKKASISMEWKK